MSNLIVGNWKLNPTSLSEAELLIKGVNIPDNDKVEAVFLPPFDYLEELIKKYPNFTWGAQGFHFEDTKNYTWVLVGHSDQRVKLGETDEMVNKKLLAALEDGFNIILAVGEIEKGQDELVVESLKASTKGVSADALNRLNIAYEPVWAISTTEGSDEDTPEHASSVIKELQKILDVRYLYGGSVDSNNIKGFLEKPSISGALVGAASLKPEEFSKILEIASKS